MKRIFFLLSFIILTLFCRAQIERPVKWSFTSINTDNQEVVLTFKATLDKGWHLYSQFIESGGPVATSFKFTASSDYELIGKVEEITKAKKIYEEAFGMDVAFFEEKAVFSQKIKLKSETTTINGVLEFMACNNTQCLPPEELDFSFDVKSSSSDKVLSEPLSESNVKAEIKNIQDEVFEAAPTVSNDSVSTSEEQPGSVTTTIAENKEKESESLWAIFIAGIFGGFAAFLMPCIFPMLPFTVSYFTKSASKKGAAVGNALFYGLSIVVIYVVLGLLVTVFFGADALNNLSTNGVFNFFFFLLLLLFAISFLGAFEITLPSSWINKSDAQADKKGVLGIFFMAATLALVSFSCTGPIIGTLLVQAAAMGQYMGPAIGMLGFAIALAIPFALFAMFPSWLNAMPKSGGWLNSVKVTLGFLELALALKFLSNVDLAYHWNLFDREVFLVLWIVTFGLLGLYLLGKLRLSHDSEPQGISAFRLLLAIVILSFTIYMIPGLWGAPLRSIAAFLPPQHTQDFDLYTSSLNNNNKIEKQSKKHDDLFHAPLNLNAFFDYNEGVEYAKKVNKPVILDFTGHTCVNCRKMEADVWSDKKVLNLLSNDFVLIQLYVDDKTDLSADEQYVSDFSGKTIKTIGNKWSDFQASRFNANSQPYYVLLDINGNQLIAPQGAVYNADEFAAFLQQGLDAFANSNK